MDIQQLLNLIESFDDVQRKEFLMQLSQDMHEKIMDSEECKDDAQFILSTLFIASCAAPKTFLS